MGMNYALAPAAVLAFGTAMAGIQVDDDLIFMSGFEIGELPLAMVYTADEVNLEDAEVYEYPYLNWDNANFGAWGAMAVGSRASNLNNTRRRSYLRFDETLLGVDAADLVRAAIRLQGVAVAEGPANVQAFEVLETWSEGDGVYHSGQTEPNALPGWLSWNQQPAFDDTLVHGEALVDNLAWEPIMLDITELVRDWLDGTRANNGIVLIGEGEGPGRFKVIFRTSEEADPTAHPEVVIETR